MALDVGLGGFVEKVEDHFGRTAAKVFVAVVGITLVSICGALMWHEVLKPLAASLPDPTPGGNLNEFAKIAVFAMLFIWLVNIMLDAADNYLKRKLRRELRERVGEARKLWEESGKLAERADEVSTRAGNVLAAAELALENVFQYAREHGMLTEDQIDELRGEI